MQRDSTAIAAAVTSLPAHAAVSRRNESTPAASAVADLVCVLSRIQTNDKLCGTTACVAWIFDPGVLSCTMCVVKPKIEFLMLDKYIHTPFLYEVHLSMDVSNYDNRLFTGKS